MTALSDAVAELQGAVSGVQTATQAVSNYIASGQTAQELAAAQSDAATAVSNIGSLSVGLKTLADQLNTLAGNPPESEPPTPVAA